MDGDWVMGDDYEMTCPFDLSITNLKKIIEEERGIHHERVNVIHPRAKKAIERNRESWSLRRQGIGNRDILIFKPTAPGGWTWHPIQYYHEQIINQIIAEILLESNYVRMMDMEKKIVKPPPVRESLAVLVKQYPDRIYCRTEISTGYMLLGISMIGQSTEFYDAKLLPVEFIPKEIMQLPTYEAGCVLAGTLCPPVDIYDFDWESYADLDSIGFEGGAIVMPDTFYNISIFSAFACRPDKNTFIPPNSFIEVYWNGKRTGRTPIRYKSFNPSWIQNKITLRQRAKDDITDCHLRINLFHFRDSSTCMLLGTIDFDGPQLKDLLAPQIDARIEHLQLQHFRPSAMAMKKALLSKKAILDSAEEEAGDRAAAEVEGEEGGGGDADVDVNADEDVAYSGDSTRELDSASKAEKDFNYDALLELDGSFEPGSATIKLAVIHCEFQMRVHFCQGIVNPEDSNISPFVICVFNGRDIGMSSVKANENWPSWQDPDPYSMKIGTLDIFECSLNIEVWQMGSTGRENLLGQLVYSGKPFVDLVAEAGDHYVRHVKDLSMPIVRTKDKDSKSKKTKPITNFGKICFDIGPAGLPPAEELSFELSILTGIMLPAETVFCQVYLQMLFILKFFILECDLCY
jgi:hypothetical protein